MKINIINIISYIAIFQSLFIAIVIYNSKNGSKTSNRILSSILIIFAILVAGSFVHSSFHWKFFIKYNRTLFSILQLALILSPLVYMYTKNLLLKTNPLQKKHLLHFIPFFAACIYLFISIVIFKRPRFIRTPFWYISSIAIVLQILIYSILTLRLLFVRFSSLKSFFSKVESPKLVWLRFFLCGYVLFWLLHIHTFIITDIWFLGKFNKTDINLYFITTFIFINSIAYISIKTPEIFTKKYLKSTLNETEKMKYLTRLLTYMENEKPYLNPSLKLSDISHKISISSIHFSQLINENFDHHFHDFINKYRIQEAQNIMLDPDNRKLNILEIAYQAGFNSKSAFNRAFKKFTGQTPTEFRNNNYSA